MIRGRRAKARHGEYCLTVSGLYEVTLKIRGQISAVSAGTGYVNRYFKDSGIFNTGIGSILCLLAR